MAGECRGDEERAGGCERFPHGPALPYEHRERAWLPSPAGSHGTEDTCNPYTSRPRLHSFASAAEALALADGVHAGGAPRGWWKRVRIGYFSSKLAAQELVNRAALEGLDVVSVLPGTFFGPFDEFMARRRSSWQFSIIQSASRPEAGCPLPMFMTLRADTSWR